MHKLPLSGRNGVGAEKSPWTLRKIIYMAIDLTAFVFLGVVVVGGLVFGCSGYGLFGSKTQLPVGRPSDIAVDSERQIYLVSETYYRVQIYSQGGTFIKAVHTPFARGGEVAVMPNGCIYVHWSIDELYVYNCDGSAEVKGKQSVKRSSTMAHSEFMRQIVPREIQHNLDYAPFSWLWPRVVEKQAPGKWLTIYRMPWYLWMINFPFPLMCFGAAGIGWFIFKGWLNNGKRKTRRARKRGQAKRKRGHH